ncbi:MAG: HEAT repeat domain-containing protein [Planctomycetes bacterium]|nr:HEAT repeat domain-containing protein [Planctomycetota bacterium]MCH9725733.1 HEAT repeat domain-containing protein [Planctomycetota bacterium]MCH9777788.1 HEAT repeat domain-containing protein [Planctomycetota bacterium]
MKYIQVVIVACALFSLSILHGCGASDSISSKDSINSSTLESDLTNADSNKAPELSEPASEPVDPQVEVKIIFQKLLAIRLDPDPDEWLKADKQLSAFGKTAIPTLITEMASPDLSARELASMYLAGLGPESKEAAPALEKALRDDSPFIQVNAASTLTHFPEYRNKAVPVLITLTKHDDPNTRLTAIHALGSLEPHSEDQLNAIKSTLTDSDTEVQLAAIKILGQIGKPAKTTLSEIQSLINDSDTSQVLREAALSSKSLIEQAKQ